MARQAAKTVTDTCEVEFIDEGKVRRLRRGAEAEATASPGD